MESSLEYLGVVWEEGLLPGRVILFPRTDGNQGMNKAGNNFKSIVKIYQENPDVFKAILNKEQADLNNILCNENFCNWF